MRCEFLATRPDEAFTEVRLLAILRAHAFLIAGMPNPDDDTLEIQRLLRRAAQLATAHSFESEQFLVAACQAFLACNPALRAKLQEEQDALNLANARSRGKVALA